MFPGCMSFWNGDGSSLPLVTLYGGGDLGWATFNLGGGRVKKDSPQLHKLQPAAIFEIQKEVVNLVVFFWDYGF